MDHRTLAGLGAGSWIDVDATGRRTVVRLSHAVYAKVLRSSMPVLHRRSSYARLAAAADEASVDDVLRGVLWRLEADLPADPADLSRAAAQALAAGALGTAERLASAAVEAGGDASPHLILANIHARRTEWSACEQQVERARRAATDDSQRARAALLQIETLLYGGDDLDRARVTAERTRSSLVDPHVRAAFEGQLALVTSVSLGGEQALLATATSPEHRREVTAGDDLSFVANATGAAVTRLMAGRTDGIDRLVDHALPRAVAVREVLPHAASILVLARACAAVYRGELCEGAEQIERGQQAALHRADDPLVGVWTTVRGEAALWRGDLRAAEASLRAGVRQLHARDLFGSLDTARGQLATVLAQLGRVGEAGEVLASQRPRPTSWARAWNACASAWIDALAGRAEAAERTLLDEARAARARSQDVWAAWLLHTAVRLDRPEAVADDLAAVATTVDGPLVVAMADHGAALASADSSALLVVTERLRQVGALLSAAEAAAQAVRILRADGRATAAARAAEIAVDLRDRCPGAATPAFTELSSNEPLTRRERQVATLARGGLTNPAIAAQLVISPRTVGNHLASVYHKMGIAGRTDL